MTVSPTVCSFESRRSDEMKQLIERFGGVPLVAPSMREIPLDDNREALQVIRQLTLGKIDCLVLLTGVGTSAMLELARSVSLEQQFLERLATIPVVVRGPKPAAVIHRLGLQPVARANAPNTWRELIEAIDEADIGLQGRTVAVQEYGVTSPELTGALEERGAAVRAIPVYRWALPEDVGPLEAAIQSAIAGETDITLFTSAQQVRHVIQVAGSVNLESEWLQAVPCVASIGPTCSEAIREAGLEVWFEADPPKMAPLVRGALEKYAE